ncbi:MAG: hypothetical protein EX254_11090 [Flavobacteriaceae bacterium]|nr:MAG: hypothetical protein EX254_11090 [Flavobacteriaceae bacterium]
MMIHFYSMLNPVVVLRAEQYYKIQNSQRLMFMDYDKHSLVIIRKGVAKFELLSFIGFQLFPNDLFLRELDLDSVWKIVH